MACQRPFSGYLTRGRAKFERKAVLANAQRGNFAAWNDGADVLMMVNKGVGGGDGGAVWMQR